MPRACEPWPGVEIRKCACRGAQVRELVKKWLLSPRGPPCRQALYLGEYMYLFKSPINTVNFFRFDKFLIREMRWAKLRQASKSIYPVICSHCNTQGMAWPSQSTIATLAGCTEKTVRSGLEGLMGLPGFRMERYVTSRGRRAIRYEIASPEWEKGRIFFFHKMIIEGGNWCLLSPTAQALYPVMRCFAFFDYFEYLERENWDHTHGDELFVFKDRDYDLVSADLDVLAEYSGISFSSTSAALESLRKGFLIEDTDPIEGSNSETWKVFLKPPRYFEREWLNSRLKKKRKEMKSTKSTHKVGFR